MENYIENIDLINAYLNNTLLKSEKLAFENRLKTDSEFNQLYNEQLAILVGITRVDLKTEINAAKQNYIRTKWMKYIGIPVGVVLVSALVYTFIFKTERPQVFESKNNNEIEVFSDSLLIEKPSKEKIKEEIIVVEQPENKLISKKIIEKKDEIATSKKTTRNDILIEEIVEEVVIEKQAELASPELISFYNSVKKAPQIIEVNTEKDFTVTCKEGTVLTIPAKSFVDTKTGKLARGTINLEVTEYYKLSDMLLGNLTTKSDDKQLETGGMLYLDANKRGSKLKLKSGRRIQMAFNNKGKENMQLFSGEESSEGVNWKLGNLIQNNLASIKFTPITKAIEEDVTISFSVIEKVPTYPGCENVTNSDKRKCMSDALNDLVKRKFDIDIAENLGLTGKQTIYARFTIDKKGNIGKINVRTPVKELGDEAVRIIELIPQLIPGKQNGLAVKTTYDLPITFKLDGETVVSNNFVTVKSDKKFIEGFEKKMDSVKTINGIFGTISNNDIERYAFATSNLGWINCDRFVNPKKGRVKFKLKIKEPNDTNVKMIFKSMSSILPSKKFGDEFDFGLLPIDEEVVLIAIKKTDNKLFLAKKEMKTKRNPDLSLEFKEVTLPELKKELESLNKTF